MWLATGDWRLAALDTCPLPAVRRLLPAACEVLYARLRENDNRRAGDAHVHSRMVARRIASALRAETGRAPRPRLPRAAGAIHGGSPGRRVLGAADRNKPRGQRPVRVPAMRALRPRGQ